MEREYEPAQRPTEREFEIRAAFLANRRSLQKTAFEFGIERAEVLRAVMHVRWWLQDSGWTTEFAKAKRAGFGDSDARLRADLVADYNTRNL